MLPRYLNLSTNFNSSLPAKAVNAGMSRLNLRKFVFDKRVADYWNGFSDSCVNCSTINDFKPKIKVELEPEYGSKPL